MHLEVQFDKNKSQVKMEETLVGGYKPPYKQLIKSRRKAQDLISHYLKPSTSVAGKKRLAICDLRGAGDSRTPGLRLDLLTIVK